MTLGLDSWREKVLQEGSVRAAGVLGQERDRKCRQEKEVVGSWGRGMCERGKRSGRQA